MMRNPLFYRVPRRALPQRVERWMWSVKLVIKRRRGCRPVLPERLTAARHGCTAGVCGA